MSKVRSPAWYARRYVERYGFHIVPIEPGRKFPRSADWGNSCLSSPETAEAFYEAKPDWNMGVALGPSRLVSLDIDCLESFTIICECLGIDLKQLIEDTPTIKARGYRLMFRLPAGSTLPYRKISWPAKNDPTGEKHRAAMRAAKEAKESGDTERERRIRAVAQRWASFCVFELRSATGDKQRQDVLPPSIHPETGLAYRWHTQPRSDWPEPPKWLLALWDQFDSFKPQIQSMCPWLPIHEAPEPKRAAKARVQYSGDGAIDAYKRSTTIEAELERYGYRRISKNRYLSPHSGTGLPGVVVYPESGKCWIHHASDPLCSESSGHPVDAFDLFCYYEHNGDIRAAAADAAKMLGIRSRTPVQSTPAEGAQSDAEPAMEPVEQADAVVPAGRPGFGSRDTATLLPWTTDKGKPLKHVDNLVEICHRLGLTVRYNVISKEEEILIPGQSFTTDNQANASLAWLTSECSLFDFPTDKVGDFLTIIADRNLYNPVVQWVTSKPWDGKSRLQQMFDTVVARDEWVDPNIKTLKETLIKRWMVSAIALAFSPTPESAEGVLVFQGPQNLGKTSWLKSLAPRELRLIKDGMMLRPDDKDSVKQVCSFWLVELGELDSTFRRADIAQLKAFITQDTDVLRRPYARRESTYARRTVFFGSVNPREFLHDETGNRRYWTIECESINSKHGLDMQQVWAEVLELWRAGEPHRLSESELCMLNESNDSYMAINPTEERILSGLDWSSPDGTWRWAQATEVLLECGVDRPSSKDAQLTAALIRKRNGGRSRRSGGKTQLWCPHPVYRS